MNGEFIRGKHTLEMERCKYCRDREYIVNENIPFDSIEMLNKKGKWIPKYVDCVIECKHKYQCREKYKENTD